MYRFYGIVMAFVTTREVPENGAIVIEPGTAIGAAGAVLAGVLILGIWVGRRQHAAEMRRRARRHVALGRSSELDPESFDGHADIPPDFTTRFCPVCRTEYLAGTLACEDCGAELVDESELPETERPIDENIVGVFRIRSPYKGQLIRQYLAAGGIRCVLMRSSLFDMLEADRVLVFESDALTAKKLIREFIEKTEIPSSDYAFEPR